MMLKRRPLILGGLSVFAVPHGGLAQPAAGKVWRIGVLSLSVPRERLLVLRSLKELGYDEGRNLVIDFRFAQGKQDQLPELATALVAGRPDLLIGLTNPEIFALKRATSTIPIVMAYVSAPVETGLITSLARPGGNLTGTTTNTLELAGKMTEILHDTIPRMSRVTWLDDPDYPRMGLYEKSASEAAAAMGLRVSFLAVIRADEVIG
jgi:putative ABC transport system substrate-binding protein